MENNEAVFKVERSTERRGEPIQEVVDSIVKKYCEDLTCIIHKIRQLVKDETTIISDQEIEDILLQLPIILYDITDSQELVGLQLDISNQILKEASSEAFKLARGTIKEKEAVTDLQTRTQQLEKIIYERSYKTIKQKIEMAIETLNAVKKIQSARQQRYDMSRF